MFDKLFKNGKIITVNEKEDIASWVAVDDGKIAAVGKESDKLPEAKEIVDLNNATMLPGLHDCHNHLMQTGYYLGNTSLLDATNLDEVIELLSEAAKAKKPGEWIVGVGFTDLSMDEKRFPDRHELDQVSESNPVLINSQTLHGCAMNTKALELVEVPIVEGVGEENDGSLNGILLADDAVFPVQQQILGKLTDEEILNYMEIAAKYSAEKGATTVHSLLGMFLPYDDDVKVQQDNKDKFDIDIVPYYQTWDFEKIKPFDLPRLGGCLTLDGAGFEYTMALFEPYPERPERRGFLLHTDEEVYNLISLAHSNDVQIAFHAVGERAIDQLIYLYKQVIDEQGKKDLRHRVEHLCLPTERHMELLAEYGLVASMQPSFSGYWGDLDGGVEVTLLGQERGSRMQPIADVLKKGGIVCGGSDSPVTLSDPIFGICSCVNCIDPNRNIPVTDAIKIHTINAAYAAHEDDVKGSIEVGKLADFTVIDKDPYEYADSKEIYDTKVLKTIKNGEVVYENK